MPVTININNLTLCHKGSSGISTATIPDVCNTPSPAGPVPIPYPNIAMASDLAKGTTSITADGGHMCALYGSEFSRSTGDEAGTAGGVTSGTFIKEATWITYSFDVSFEGQGACRLSDKMFHNHSNTANMGGLIQQTLGVSDAEFCQICKDCVVEAGAQIEFSKTMQTEYRKAGMNPANLTGADIQATVMKSLASQGFQVEVGGTTDSAGDIDVPPPDPNDPCGKITHASTVAHENVHKANALALQAKLGCGPGAPAYDAAWNNAQNWVDDEVNAHATDQKFMRQFKKECKESCS